MGKYPWIRINKKINKNSILVFFIKYIKIVTNDLVNILIITIFDILKNLFENIWKSLTVFILLVIGFCILFDYSIDFEQIKPRVYYSLLK